METLQYKKIENNFNIFKNNEIRDIESRKIEGAKFGFKKATCVIDSQSAPALSGIEEEQKYMRAFLIAGKNDLVVTDFYLNQTYINDYLKNTLNLDLPEFLTINNNKKGTLSENIMDSKEGIFKIKNWIETNNGEIQFFNITDKEEALIEELNVNASCGDLLNAVEIGSKPGFKQLCKEIDMPVANGGICVSFFDTKKWVEIIMDNGKDGFIKAENGTGGTELQSNIMFSKNELIVSGKSIDEYVQNKLDYFGEVLGDMWVVEEKVEGNEGSVHIYIDSQKNNKAFILGALTENNSYIGGYYPYKLSSSEEKLLIDVDTKLSPYLKAMDLTGFHCLDFKGDYFLEDNVRPGALDFVHQFVGRIIEKNFNNQKYAWYHCHIPVSKNTSFEEVFEILGDKMNPKNLNENCLVVISNPEVLPYGRSLDLTVVNIGSQSSVENAELYFNKVKKIVEEKL